VGITAGNVNVGTFNLSPAVPFNLNGATLNNVGSLNLMGAYQRFERYPGQPGRRMISAPAQFPAL